MSCNCSNYLIGGIGRNCRVFRGGIRKIYITDYCNVTGVVEGSPITTISTINMASGTLFYEFGFNKGTSSYTEVVSGDPATSQVVAQTITLKLNGREKTKRDTLALLMGFKDLAVIIQDSNNKFWLFGRENAIVMTENNGESGTNATDFNGYTLTLVGEETELANEIDPAAVAAVI